MKTLIIAAHPQLERSRVNKIWIERLQKEQNVYVHNLYETCPDGKIDVEKEQALVLEHDRVVFQFPFYWYSTPALLKQWQDEVLTYGWAYGSIGNKLHGKEFMAVLSVGGPAEAYQAGGFNHYTISELLRPLQAMANLTGMVYLPPFALHGVNGKTDEEIANSAEQLAAVINKPR